MSELENAIKTLTKTADKKELPYIIADIIKKNCDSSTINLLSQYLNETKPSEATEYLEAWNFIKDQMPNFTFSHLIEEMRKNSIIIDNALQRLEAIDNAKPNEALECLEEIRDFRYGENKLLVCQTEMYNTLKQALLKAKGNVRSEETLQKYYQEGITLDSVRALKQERDNYKKAFAVVWRKPTQIRAAVAYFRSTLNPTYEDYCTTIMSEDQLTKEEFETFREVE